MDPRRNPYSPGAGSPPAELVGRDAELEAFEILRARAEAGRPERGIVFYGLRGVGKTVLLNELFARGRAAGWLAAKIEADLGEGHTDLRSQVASALNTALRQAKTGSRVGAAMRRALGTFTSFSLHAAPDGSLSIGIDADPVRGRGDTGRLLADLVDLAIDLGEAAKESGVGAVLFIDELQHLSVDEMGVLCQACHEAGQQQVPFFVIGAGLPSLPGLLAEARSYAERLFSYVRIDRLPDDAARAALTNPALDEGVVWSDAAVGTVLAAAGGYPYFLQQFGQTTWNAAVDTPISGDDAAVGVKVGFAQLDAGFFRARWERATPAERDYMAAMAVDGPGPSATGEIAGRLSRKPKSLGPARANLIAKGLVYAPEHGQIAFTVPGMAEFIAREVSAREVSASEG